MDIRQLKYFESLVRNKQFTKAADELHISQPSLSYVIKSLEEQLGTTLIERSTRNVIPTEAGLILYKHTCRILRDFNNIIKEMEDVKEVGASTINIGIIESTKHWMPKVIKKFNNKFPNVSLKLRHVGTMHIEENLNNYNIHFGITSNKITSKCIYTKKIYEDELVLITSIHHPLNKIKTINLSSLKGESLILYRPGYQITKKINHACSIAGFEPSGLFEVDTVGAALGLVKENLAAAIVPKSYLKNAAHQEFHSIKLLNPTPILEVFISYHKQRFLTPAAKYLISVIKNVCSEPETVF